MLLGVLNGMKSVFYKDIGTEVVNAILISQATHDSPAKYHTKKEQATKLQAMYDKYTKLGAWSAAAPKVSRCPRHK